jgi:hypothetical protein
MVMSLADSFLKVDEPTGLSSCARWRHARRAQTNRRARERRALQRAIRPVPKEPKNARFDEHGDRSIDLDDVSRMLEVVPIGIVPLQAADPDRRDTDEFYDVRLAVLRRALDDLEQWHDVRDGRRALLQEAADFDGEGSEILGFFFDDYCGVFHPSEALEAVETETDSTIGPFWSVPAVFGFWTVEGATGPFSFWGICRALGLNFEEARSSIRRWIDRRNSAPVDGPKPAPQTTPRWHTRDAAMTSDELLDEQAIKDGRDRAIVTHRSLGKSIEFIARIFRLKRETVLRILSKHRDELPPEFAPPRRRSAAQVAEIIAARIAGLSIEDIMVQFAISAERVRDILLYRRNELPPDLIPPRKPCSKRPRDAATLSDAERQRRCRTRKLQAMTNEVAIAAS